MFKPMDDKIEIEKDWYDQYKFHLVDSIDKLKVLANICKKSGLVALDTETTGLDSRIYKDEYFDDGVKTKYGIRTVDKVVGVCISYDGENGYYIPLGHKPPDSGNLPWDESWEIIKDVVDNTRIIFHNARYDIEMIYPLIGKGRFSPEEFEDTMIIAKVINPDLSVSAGLKQLTKSNFGIDQIELHELFSDEKRKEMNMYKEGLNFSLLHPKEGVIYGSSDGIFTYKLYHKLIEKLSDTDKEIYKLEKAFMYTIQKMERNRVHIDIDKVRYINKEAKHHMSTITEAIVNFSNEKTDGDWSSLNVGSATQLSTLFFTDRSGFKMRPLKEMLDGNEYDPESTKVIQYSLADDMLKLLDDRYGKNYEITIDDKQMSIFKWITEYRHYEKIIGSYTGKFELSIDKNGDVRPSYKQIGTSTSRLSSKAGQIKHGYSGINFQGIPRDSDTDKPELFKQIRECIIPRPGFVMVKLDYAGEELRVATNMSGDPVWSDSFLNKDGDVHSITARALFGKYNITKQERGKGKACNFAFIYGGGAGSIARNIGCSIEEGQRKMDQLKKSVPVLMKYIDGRKSYAMKHKCIYTAFGRRIPISNTDSEIRGLRKKAERQAPNFTIQATSADVLKIALVLIDKGIRDNGWEDDVRYVMTVHDEIVFEIRPHLLMEAVPKIDEWMCSPWKIQKAYGRQWDVPLETEPGIDQNWKARYDFPMMVHGVPLHETDFNKDGTLKKKLKSDQYIKNGRLYQKVPDFLEGYIIPDTGEAKEEPETEENVSVADEAVKAKEEAKEAQKNIPESVDVDSFGENVKSDIPEETKQPVQEETKQSIPEKIEQPVQKEIELKTDKPNSIFVYNLTSTPNRYLIKKINAVLILSEGDTPIKIMIDGQVLVNGSKYKVDVPTFKVLSRMFGL